MPTQRPREQIWSGAQASHGSPLTPQARSLGGDTQPPVLQQPVLQVMALQFSWAQAPLTQGPPAHTPQGLPWDPHCCGMLPSTHIPLRQHWVNRQLVHVPTASAGESPPLQAPRIMKTSRGTKRDIYHKF